ncbi:InlB B-repeat-containing protein [Mycoplasmatota bacterium WC44]
MKKILIITLLILLIPNVYGYDHKDCEIFVLPRLGITEYQTCLQNPDAYKSHFIYHEVKFYNGASLLKSIDVVDGDDATPPPNPSKTGYTFIGWSNSYTNITGPINIYAEFESTEYTVTFKDYDGTTLRTESVTYGEDAIGPSVSRTGYNFTGWSSSVSNITSSTTVFAEYEKVEYNVTFYGYRNTILKSQSVSYGSYATPPNAPTVSGYEFDGWIGNYSNITSNKNIYADYDVVTHTVKFKSNGLLIKTDEVEDGGRATAPSDPSMTGYTFTGWDKSFSYITSNKIINAIFEINTYQVVYHGLDKILKTDVVDYNNESVPPVNHIEEGYDFLGWNGSYNNIKSNTDIYGIYSLKTYQVVFKDYDGTTLDTTTINHGESASTINPDRLGYDFIGWSDTITNITEDKTLIAKYKIKNLTVNYYDFDNNLVKSELVNYGESSVPPVVDKESYDFVGWDQSYENITSSKDIRSIFKIKEYTIQIKDYDGTDIASLKVTHGSDVEYKSPTRDGFIFTGWSVSTLNITSNKTIFAEYERIKYSVNFYIDGELFESVLVDHNSTPIQPTPPLVEGKTFIGWDVDLNNITSDTSVSGIYDVNKYNVTFMNYDMTVLKNEEITHGGSATPPAASKPGSTFSNWSGSFNNVTSDITLVAEFDEITFSVYFYGYNSELLSIETVKLMGDAIVPAPRIISGYDFIGWMGNYKNIYNDEEVYAIYSKITEETEENLPNKEIEEETVLRNVIFFDHDGSKIYDIDVEDGNSVSAPNVINIEGYDFLGWDKNLTNVVNDLTVNPIYKKKVYTVRFINYDESILSVEKVNYGDNANPPIVNRKGYNFTSWDNDYKHIMSDLDLVALFEPIKYRVEFIDINGELLRVSEVSTDEEIEIFDPYHVGYEFIGWDKDLENISNDMTVTALYEVLDHYTMTDTEKLVIDVSITNSAEKKVKMIVNKDVEFTINYLKINNEFFSENDFTVKSKSKGLFSNERVTEIVFYKDLDLINLQVISITEKYLGKEYLYDLRTENKALVNNLFTDKDFKISTELSNFDIFIMWLKNLLN